ncbi:MAG: sodium:solute symporter family protein [Dorea sp.]|jgi:SSS family solute:Na+ symporter|nr:sodium:solute symporter family protein [Dorea sp.]
MSTHIMISMIALAAYTALMFYVGIGKAYDKEVVSTNRGYFIGGGTGYFVLFFTTAATWFSTFIYMGAPGSFYTHGIGWIVIAAWNLTIMFLMGVFGTRLWRMSKTNGYVTPGDLLGDYYQSPGLQKTISAGQFIFCFPYMMAQIAGVGLAVSILTDGMIPSSVGCIYAAVVIGIYVYFGGFKSQAWVDTMQGIMFTVILVMTVGIMITVNGGGLAGLFAGLENAGKNFLLYVTGDEGYWTWKIYLSYLLTYAFGGYFAPYVWQRSYAAKNGKTILQIAGSLGFFYVFAISTMVMLVGFGGRALGVGVDHADSIMVTTMKQYAPYMAILVVVGILAAGMSTVSSILVTTSSLITVDFIEKMKPDMSKEKMQKVSRYVLLAVLTAGLLLSMVDYSGIVILVNGSLSGFMQVFWPVFGVFFWKHATKQGAITGFAAGIAVSLALTAAGIEFLGFTPSFWGFVINGALFIIVSICSPKISKEHREEFLSPLKKYKTLKD